MKKPTATRSRHASRLAVSSAPGGPNPALGGLTSSPAMTGGPSAALAPFDWTLWGRSIFENTSDIVCVLNREGTVLFVNHTVPWLTPEQVVGHSVYEFTFPEYVEEVRRYLALALEGSGTVGPQETPGLGPNGTVGWFETRFVPIRQGGIVVGVALFVREVTDRHHAEEALRESERRYRILFEDNPEPSWVMEREGFRILAVNEAAVRSYGYDRDEFLAMSAPGLWPAEEVQKTGGPLEELLEAPCQNRLLRHRKKDGTVIDVEITAEEIEFGSRPSVLVLARDVTERRRMEEQLRAARIHLEHLLRASPAIIYTARPNQELPVTYVSENVTPQLGYEPREFMGIPGFWQSLIHPDDAEQVLKNVETLIERGWNTQEYRIRHRNGEYRWMHDRSRVVRDAHGASVELLGFSIDVTEQKKVEAALQDSHEQLQALSRQLLEAQESERRGLARELHDEIGQALTAIRMNLQAILRHSGSKDVAAHVVEGIAQVDQAIERVRALAVELRPSVLDDLGLVAALRWYLERQSHWAGFATRLDAGDLGEGRLSPLIETTCFRVVQEAVTNVARHAGAKNVQVSLRREGDVFEVTVEDDGVGFDVEQARERAAEGASLGLLGMQERASLAGGHLAIDSAPGRGSRVRAVFAFPLEATREQEGESAS
jgi:PAS domain S-box-containing protein